MIRRVGQNWLRHVRSLHKRQVIWPRVKSPLHRGNVTEIYDSRKFGRCWPMVACRSKEPLYCILTIYKFFNFFSFFNYYYWPLQQYFRYFRLSSKKFLFFSVLLGIIWKKNQTFRTKNSRRIKEIGKKIVQKTIRFLLLFFSLGII